MSWFKRKAAPAPQAPQAPLPPLPEASVEAMKVVANAPLINATDDHSLTAAHYRADAIAREIEQRASEGREQHTDHDMMVGEAMAHAWRLVAAGRWTRDHVVALEKRLFS